MSYRHSSYRKLTKAVNLSFTGTELATAEMDRVMHWSNRPPLPKPPGWGKPKSQRAA